MTAIERLREHVDEMCVNAGDGVCTEDCDRCDISTLRWLVDLVEAETRRRVELDEEVASW